MNGLFAYFILQHQAYRLQRVVASLSSLWIYWHIRWLQKTMMSRVNKKALLCTEQHKTTLETQFQSFKVPHLCIETLTAKLHMRSGAGQQVEKLYCCKKQTNIKVRQTSKHLFFFCIVIVLPSICISVYGGVCVCVSHLSLLVLDRQVEFKLCWELILRVQSV